jgi:hypothetical protein
MQATIASSILALAATIACTSGCLSKPCSANVVPAVYLTITDPNGEVVEAAEIELDNEDDSSGPFTASCGSQGGSCADYPVGQSAGTYTITITAPDYEPLSLTVEVDEDDEDCHPVTESVEVELVAAM